MYASMLMLAQQQLKGQLGVSTSEAEKVCHFSFIPQFSFSIHPQGAASLSVNLFLSAFYQSRQLNT